MKREILISRKRGEDGHKVVSVRMRDETLAKLDDLSVQTNRSRNEYILHVSVLFLAIPLHSIACLYQRELIEVLYCECSQNRVHYNN